MKILIVSATNQRRGAEMESLELASRLRDFGLHVEHVALSDVGVGQPCLDIEPIANSWRSPSALVRLRRRAKEVDLVLAFGSTALPACAIALLGAHTTFVYRSIGDPRQWVRGRVHRWRTGRLIRRASNVVALWPGAADAIVELYGYPRDKVSVIPNARSTDDFPLATVASRAAARQKLGYSPEDRVVAVVGTLTEEKRVDRAIEVIASDHTLNLLVAGDGPLRLLLEELAERRCPGRVTFVGNTDNVRQVYAAADVVLITSRTEGMPGVAIEAGMSGIPVVATDVGGVSSIVKAAATGWLSNSDLPDDLLVGIRWALEMGPKARGSIAAVVRNNFNFDTTTSMWTQHLEHSCHSDD